MTELLLSASENRHTQIIDYQYITQYTIESKRRNNSTSIILIINTLNIQE